jgi:hypothetical protein
MVVTLLASCGGHVPVPPELQANVTVLPVTERKTFGGIMGDDPFVMGPYRVSGLDRTWRSGPGWNYFGLLPGDKGFSKETTIRDFSFNFAGPGGTITSACSTQLVEYLVKGHVTLEHHERRTLCRCAGAGLNAEARLSSDDGKWSGEALLHGQTMPLQIMNTDTNGVPLPKAIGYQIGAPTAIGLVETRPPGQVWLANHVDGVSHAEMSCLFSALLLVEQPPLTKKK